MINNKTSETIGHILVITGLIILPAQWGIFLALSLQFIGIGARIIEQRAIKTEQQALQTQHAEGSWAQILGVEESASIEQCSYVKKLLTEIYHPKYGKAPNAKMMARVNKAHKARINMSVVTKG